MVCAFSPLLYNKNYKEDSDRQRLVRCRCMEEMVRLELQLTPPQFAPSWLLLSTEVVDGGEIIV